MPNPSAFIVPCRCLRGAHDCRYSPCGGSISTDRSVAGRSQVGEVAAHQAVSGAEPAASAGAERAVRKPAKICRRIG